MLTLFTIPKPFKGHIGTIQRNAISSWTRIVPRPEILLFGKDAGTAEAARELGAVHMPEVAVNEYGTPLLSDIFRQAQTHARGELLGYVNADIIVVNDFARAAEKVRSELKSFLVVSERINIEVREELKFEPEWEATLQKLARESGTLSGPTAIDIFLFPKGTFPTVPKFGVGRLWFDQWLIKSARKRNIPVVDVSRVAPLLHQNHDYNHVSGGADWVWKGKEAEENLRLYGAMPHSFTLLDVTHELARDGHLRRVMFRRRRAELSEWLWKHTVLRTEAVRKRLGLQRKKVRQVRSETAAKA